MDDCRYCAEQAAPGSPRDMLRRTFLGRGVAGLGLLGLNALLNPRLFAADGSHGVVNPLHHPAKAKRVIFLYQAGGPSHLETFDYKPKLAEMNGKPMPESFTKGQQIAQLQGRPLVCFGPQHGFQQVRQIAARRSASCSRTSAASPTMSASSAPCGPSRSTTIPPTPS